MNTDQHRSNRKQPSAAYLPALFPICVYLCSSVVSHASQIVLRIIANQALGIPFVESILVQPDLDSTVLRLADDLVVANEVPGELTKLVEYVCGYQAANVAELDDHGCLRQNSGGQHRAGGFRVQ